MPEIPDNFQLAKGQLKQDIQTDRITQDNIIFSYLAAQQLGLKEDIRKKVYEQVDKITFKDIQAFHNKYLSHKPYTYVILASEKRLPKEELQKIGEFKKVSLEELFGF